MATTRLTDLVIPEVFTAYVQLLTEEKSAFRASGVLESSPLLSQLLSGGARSFNVPHFRDLAQTESNISSDDPGSNAVPENITTGQEIAQRHNRNQVWSSMDLNAALAGADPLEAIAALVADYWVREEQRMIIAALQGVFADNEANDAGDMINDIALGGAGTPTAANLFSAEAVIDTQQTMGDSSTDLGIISLHSVVFSRAKKNNLIDLIPDARGEVDIPTFLGLRVVVDDGRPAVPVSGNTEFSSYIYGSGSIARGESDPLVPTETNREPLAGDGGGQEFLSSRVQWAQHPRGFAWLPASQVGESPTNAELALAANWDRRFNERKQIKLAELRTNG